MIHLHRARFSVRSYELDSYRHLNNGVYVSWLEQGRLLYLQSLGFSYDGFADRREWIVVARTEVDFRLALVLGDEVELETWVCGLGRSSLRFRHAMRRLDAGRPGALACEALTVMVFSGEGGRSIPIPGDFRAAVGETGERPA